MSEKKTLGVILSGAGVYDGSEIHEAVLCLLAIDEAGAQARIVAPSGPLKEIDHVRGEETGAERDILIESARIARGKIIDIADIKGTDVDGWVLPGGFGAAKNLTDFASKGAAATAHKDVVRIVREAFAAQLPVGACCMAPAVLATVTRSSGPALTLTIGNDAETAAAITSMGSTHKDCTVENVVLDEEHKVVTAPAYMYDDASIGAVAKGIRKMVKQVVAWA